MKYLSEQSLIANGYKIGYYTIRHINYFGELEFQKKPISITKNMVKLRVVNTLNPVAFGSKYLIDGFSTYDKKHPKYFFTIEDVEKYISC